MLSTFVPIYVGSQVNFGESIRTVQEDLREVAPSIFLGVPRTWCATSATSACALEVYGLTESSGMIFGQHPDRVKVGTVGEPIAGVGWRVGESGELQVRGDMVFEGYYKNPQAGGYRA